MMFNYPWLKRKRRVESKEPSTKTSKTLILEAGQKLRDRRKDLRLSRNELAMRTKITTPVLEAIENGWTKTLPESTYLSAMLIRLEDELALPRGSLDGALATSLDSFKGKTTKSFISTNLDFFGTWQGSLLYIGLIFCFVLMLNRQQEYLASINSKTYKPISPEMLIEEKNNSQPINRIDSEHNKKKSNNKRSFYSNIINSILRKSEVSTSQRLLELKITRESNLTIKSGQGNKAELESIVGNIKFKLYPPIYIKSNPSLTPYDEIIWGGVKYTPEEINSGVYKFEETLN